VAAFYLDHNFPLQVALTLRGLGHEASTAQEHGLAKASDGKQLLFAAQHQWILVTHNRKDFRSLHDAWLVWREAWGLSDPHFGILNCDPASIPDLANALDAFTQSDKEPHGRMYEWTKAAGWREYKPRDARQG
jgi:predicted nuclease of predicted toxin-antitoxin system